MENELKKEIEILKAQVKELKDWKEKKERQQISLPLDVASINVLNEAFKTAMFDRINLKDLHFRTGLTVNPTISGQMVYFDGASKGFRIHVNGFTGQLDATSI